MGQIMPLLMRTIDVEGFLFMASLAQTEGAMAMDSELGQLNQEFAVMQQQGGIEAQRFFTKILADKLVFRRANGKVGGKPEFLKSLHFPNPFIDYRLEYLEEIPLTTTKNRVMVTLLERTCDQYETIRCFHNIRLFMRHKTSWKLEFWYVYEDICA